MKKLFLSLIILLSAINPMFGMEDDEGQQGVPCGEVSLGEAVLGAIANHLHAGNTHLVGSIAREWHEQNPNGTYRDFVNRYNRTLPVNLMRAVWREVMRVRQVGLLQSIAGYAGEIARIMMRLNTHQDIFAYPLGARNGIFIYLNSDSEEISCSYSYNCIMRRGVSSRFPTHYRNEEVEDFFSEFDHSIGRPLDRVVKAVVCLLGWSVPQQFCTIRIPLTGQGLGMSSDKIKQRLHTIVQRACQRGFCVLIQLVSNGANHNISHIIVVHNGVIALVPSIVFPAGAPDEQCQQIAQDAMARAIDHQQVFRTIQEAVHYLEGLDS